jgi:hypothetical protein
MAAEKNRAKLTIGLNIFIRTSIGREKNSNSFSELALDIILGVISQKIRKNIV